VAQLVLFSTFGHTNEIVVLQFCVFVCILPLDVQLTCGVRFYFHTLGHTDEIVVLKFCVFVCVLPLYAAA
jgi:hypothetical protein